MPCLKFHIGKDFSKTINLIGGQEIAHPVENLSLRMVSKCPLELVQRNTTFSISFDACEWGNFGNQKTNIQKVLSFI